MKAKKLDPKIKKVWLKALRSGEYKQTEAFLCVEKKEGEPEFCCLGVLCEEVGDGEWRFKKGNKNECLPPHWTYSDPGRKISFASFPPPALMRRVGLDIRHAQELTNRNDEGWSFEEIADYIEENL